LHFDPQLINKLPISLIPPLLIWSIPTLAFTYLFSVWSLVLDFFNEVPNCPSNFNIYAIKLLICPNYLFKIAIRPLDFNVFQLKPKLTSKIIFLAIKPSINPIKFLNFQFSIFLFKLNFLCQ
jgi:hypothetical protein